MHGPEHRNAARHERQKAEEGKGGRKERKGEREKENNKVFDFYDGRTVIFDVLHRV